MFKRILQAARRHSAAGFLIGALAIALGYAASLKNWTPVFDEIEYLSYGRSVALAGVFAATPAGPTADAGPGREPAYPALIGAAMRLDPRLYRAMTDCWPVASSCAGDFSDLRYLNAALIAIAAWFVFLTVGALGHGTSAAVISAAYVLLNLQMNKTATHVISDYLAVSLVGLLSFMLVKAAATQRESWWIGVGTALAALGLTKNIYVLFAGLTVAGLCVCAFRRRARLGSRAFLPVVVVTVLSFGPVGLWHARNAALFESSYDPRAAFALSTREALNDMSTGENVAAFLWWTRGFGEKTARRLLPESWWHRHELYAEDGFYLQGQVHRYEERVRRLMEERNWTRARATAAVPGVVIAEILTEWPSYIATMPAVFYRGLWFDEFIVLGFPTLVWLVIRSTRGREFLHLLALLGGLFSLAIYTLTSLNIPRYQFTAAPALAIAAGIAVEAVWRRWRARHRDAARGA